VDPGQFATATDDLLAAVTQNDGVHSAGYAIDPTTVRWLCWTTAGQRRTGQRTRICIIRAVSGTPARSGASPAGSSGDPRGGGG
jgi:hypothetical protein